MASRSLSPTEGLRSGMLIAEDLGNPETLRAHCYLPMVEPHWTTVAMRLLCYGVAYGML